MRREGKQMGRNTMERGEEDIDVRSSRWEDKLRGGNKGKEEC